jgi:hypothetical protein
MVTPGAFDATWGMIAVCLGVPVTLAFGALVDGAFWSGRFKRDYGVEEGSDEVNVFVVFIRLEIYKE